jgi:hypothetical protein
MITSLAAVTIGAATLGAIAPASADVYSGRSGQTPSPFATGVVGVGLSPSSSVAGDFTALYSPARSAAKSCAPVVMRHQRTDTIDYPAPGSC